MKPLLSILLFLTAMTCSAQTDTSIWTRMTGLYKWRDSSKTITGHTLPPYFISSRPAKIVGPAWFQLSDNYENKVTIMYDPLTGKTSDTIQLFYPALKFIRVGKYLYKIDSNTIIHINKP